MPTRRSSTNIDPYFKDPVSTLCVCVASDINGPSKKFGYDDSVPLLNLYNPVNTDFDFNAKDPASISTALPYREEGTLILNKQKQSGDLRCSGSAFAFKQWGNIAPHNSGGFVS